MPNSRITTPSGRWGDVGSRRGPIFLRAVESQLEGKAQAVHIPPAPLDQDIPLVVDWLELRQDGDCWEGELALPDAPDEFANSISCYHKPCCSCAASPLLAAA